MNGLCYYPHPGVLHTITLRSIFRQFSTGTFLILPDYTPNSTFISPVSSTFLVENLSVRWEHIRQLKVSTL